MAYDVCKHTYTHTRTQCFLSFSPFNNCRSTNLFVPQRYQIDFRNRKTWKSRQTGSVGRKKKIEHQWKFGLFLISHIECMWYLAHHIPAAVKEKRKSTEVSKVRDGEKYWMWKLAFKCFSKWLEIENDEKPVLGTYCLAKYYVLYKWKQCRLYPRGGLRWAVDECGTIYTCV